MASFLNNKIKINNKLDVKLFKEPFFLIVSWWWPTLEQMLCQVPNKILRGFLILQDSLGLFKILLHFVYETKRNKNK